LPWLLVIPVMWWADKRSGPAHHPALVGAAGWPFDLLLVLLSAIQITNVVLTVSVAHRGQGGIDALVTILLVGVSSGYSAIVVAHELVHRKSRGLFLLGRLLLVTVLYDHFTTEHVRGHHARVGTPEDPATARFGEPYEAFFRRTVPAQFRSAWRIECARLGDEDMRWYDLRLLRSAVVHGVVVEIALAVLTVYAFGPSALLVLVGQAYIAVRLLEAVNYFEHYGLRRVGKKVRPIDSWDSDSWFTLFALVGLSRHADHHAYASRPFHSLRPWDESPKLPNGYIVTALMAIFANRKLRRLLATELERKKLGPFAAPPPSQNMVPSST
jgi:alkane 1-monooxygenase